MSRRTSTPPQLPGFEFVEPLGSGGFADVFLYTQLGLGRRVAVKVLLSSDLDAGVQASFEAEATVMAQLSNHPSIVAIYQAGVTPDGRPFLVMEYCPPPHLGMRVRAKPLTVARALEVVVQLAGAVETAHRLGILHRDIKPANILSTEFGRAALTDFGISVTTASAESGEAMGMSVPWAPPEQLAVGSPMGPSGDVYSLAATLWTALVGRSPFHVVGGANDPVSMAARVRTMPVPPTRRPDVSESLERVLATAMAKNPAERFPTALAFAHALQRVQAELHQSVTTIDVLDEHVVDLPAEDDGGGTRVSGFVSVDPDLPSTNSSSAFLPVDRSPAPAPRVGVAPDAVAGTVTGLQPYPTATGAGLPTATGPFLAGPGAPVVDATVAGSPAQGGTGLPLDHQGAPTEPAHAPGAPAEPTSGSALRWVAAVVGLVVVAGLGWFVLGQGDGRGTDPKAMQTPTAKPVDPLQQAGPGQPVKKSVKVAGDRLEVEWTVPDPEPGDEYLVQTQYADDVRVNNALAEKVTETTASVLRKGATCVTVVALRGTRTSEATLMCSSN